MKRTTFLLLCIIALFSIVFMTAYLSAQDTTTIQPSFRLFDPGQTNMIDYTRYGRMRNVGTADYSFQITKEEDLAAAVGEGVYPNTTSVLRDPAYAAMIRRGDLQGTHWDYIGSPNPQRDFFKWATANEDPGVRQFYTAVALDRSGNTMQTIKAFYSVVLNFPLTVGWAENGSFFYFLGPGAMAKCIAMARNHPELGMKLEGAMLKIMQRDNINFNPRVFNKSDWEIVINPGRWVARTAPQGTVAADDILGESASSSVSTADMGTRIVGYLPNENARVKIAKWDNGDFQLLVNNKPMMIQAVAYSCTKVGEGPDVQTAMLFADRNRNGLIDGVFESWIDINKNNRQDANEQRNIGDASLLKEMGCNAIRIYHNDGDTRPRATIHKLYTDYGIYTILGNFMGMYATDSGASWDPGTDYTDPEQCARIKESVRKMVEAYKDEDGVLMWMLGNENNYSLGAQVSKNPVAYYKFVNEVATMIHEMDPTRPVAICNGDTQYSEKIARYAPAIDVFGCNSYQGSSGFGGLWYIIKSVADRPALITEYGVDAYHQGQGVNEDEQMEYHKGNWTDIMMNRAGYGIGNSIGGVCYEWMDEWWKHDQNLVEGYSIQMTNGSWQGPQPDHWMHEEFLGIVGQGNGAYSPYMRHIRKAYLFYRHAWQEQPW